MIGNEIVFQKSVTGRTESERYQFILTCDKPTPIKQLRPLSMDIHESFSSVTPGIVFTFIDANGSLFSNAKIDYENIFYLSIGNNFERAIETMPLRVSTIENQSSVSGKVESIYYKITFFCHEWNSLISRSRNRAWEDRSYSDVVKQIVEECKFPSYEIETSKPEDTIYQPNIPNAKMIRYASEKAVSKAHDDAYDFGCTVKGHFIFKSFTKLIQEAQGAINSKNVPLMTMNNGSPGNKTKSIEDNFGFPQKFYSFDMGEDYSTHTIEGGTGFDASYYDFIKGEYVRRKFGRSDLNIEMLSERASIADDDNSKTYKVFGGRDTKTIDRTKARLSSILNAYNRYKMTTDFSIDAHIGKIVELVFPLSKADPDTENPLSLSYSGLYLVTGVNHKVDMERNFMFSEIHVTRPGFNNQENS